MVDYNPKNKLPVKKNASRKTSKKPKKTLRRRILIYLLILAALGILAFAALFLSVFFGFTGHVPTSAQLLEIRNPQASEVYSDDGKLLGRYYTENRSNVKFEEISPNVIHALIATEDARFYDHRGIDEIALARVLFKTILLGDRSAGGGSTLSQQIAKNLFPRNDVGILSMPVNKLREAIIAYRLERIYSKEEILTLYLNTVPFGENIFGIEVASERFFSKNPKDLSIDEAAVLVGMLKANNAYNPRLYPERSKERRNVVISLMVTNGYLTEEEGKTYREKPLGISYTRISFNEGPAPYFLEMMKPELLEWCASNTKENGEAWNLYTDGLRISTTINSDFQLYAHQSVTGHMKELQEVFDKHWEDRDPWNSNNSILRRAVERTDRYKNMVKAGISQEKIEESFNKKITASLFTWDGMKEMETTPLDSVKHYLRFLNTGFLALDPRNGELKAWVGGIDFRFFKYDHVLSERQIGSTFKPFVYLAALENGLSPFDYFPAEQQTYEQYDNWSPGNSDGQYEGYYSMEGALSRSINTVAAEIIIRTGVENTISTARQLGISSNLPKVPSLALGVASMSLRELLFAYATMVNGGIRTEPHYLRSISDHEGNLLASFEPPATRRTAVNEINCQLVLHMMESAINEGTGIRIRTGYHISGDFAGKTGTTQNHSDGWFVGLTPNLVTGAWVGAEDPGIHFRNIAYGQGSFMALPIVGRFFHQVYGNEKYRQLQYAQFPDLDEELLADLDIPPYREMLELDRPDFFDRIFAGKSKEEKLREIQEPEKVEEKKGLWKSIKGIFRKKDN